MTDILLKSASTIKPNLEDPFTHIVCCEAPDESSHEPTFCGQDSASMHPVDTEINCVVCADMQYSSACPRGGNCKYWGL